MKMEKLVKLVMPAIIVLLGTYTGYGEYKKSQEAPSVTVNVESMPTQSPHPNVGRIVRDAIKQHKQDYH